VSPATGLRDGTLVTVTVTGLGPQAFVQAFQCGPGTGPIGEDCDFSDSAFAEADRGTATLTLAVDAVLHPFTGDDDEPGPAAVDCRRPEGCTLAIDVFDFTGPGQTLRRSLAFDPDAPLAPPPTVAVTPATGLRDMQAVTARVSGLVWSTFGTVVQCTADPVDADDCDEDVTRQAQVTNGAFTVSIPASARIHTARRGLVDCRQAGACVLAATPDPLRAPEKVGTTPLAFDPDAPLVLPTLTIAPATGLVDGQSVTATGRGFTGDEFVTLYECGPLAGGEHCRRLADIFPPPGGGFTQRITLDAQLFSGGQSVDCRRAATPCALVASAGSPQSAHAARAPLAFLPDGPLRPGPELTVTPSTDLPGEATVTAKGVHFAPQSSLDLEVCAIGDPGRCDPQADQFILPDSTGTFSVQVSVAATFTDFADRTVDCRTVPGCAVIVTDFSNDRQVSVPLTFAPATAGVRYLDPVFDDVEVTRDVVYRQARAADGTRVDLTLDIYEPAGDTAAQRPAVVWLPGGWFAADPSDTAGSYARDLARRGYVVITADYRLRPGLRCCPTDDAVGVTQALLDAYDDARAAVAWVRDHAADHRVDPRAIVAGGSDAGAATALDLAHLPGQMGKARGTTVAAAVGVAGVDLGRPDAGEAPVLALHAVESTIAPLHLSQWACARSRKLGVPCQAVGYSGFFFDDLARERQRDIVRRSVRFLANNALTELGYVGPLAVPPSPPAPPASGGGAGGDGPSVPAGTDVLVGGATTPQALARSLAPPAQAPAPAPGESAAPPMTLASDTSSAAAAARTGVAVAALVAVAAAVLWARRRDDRGAGGLPGAGALAIAAVAILGIGALGTVGALTFERWSPWPGDRDGGEEAADPAGVHDMSGMDHDRTPMDHGHDGGSAAEHGHPGTEDHGHTGAHTAGLHGTSGGDHDHGAGGTGEHGHGTGGGTGGTGAHGHGTGGAGEHGHETGGHGNGGSHGHPGDPNHPHPPADPNAFPSNWTKAQVAFAKNLIAATERSLPKYRNPGVLPLVGYVWILDGTGVNRYQHWININRITDTHILDSQSPEALVFRNAPTGPVLEAAMYILPVGYTLDTVPRDIEFLPGWHVHDNLCFDGNFRVVALAENGTCARGILFITPPMVHVWLVDTRCGRFAGVDEHGLQCTPHEHDH
jgi:acetyl esterase/lipase